MSLEVPFSKPLEGSIVYRHRVWQDKCHKEAKLQHQSVLQKYWTAEEAKLQHQSALREIMREARSGAHQNKAKRGNADFDQFSSGEPRMARQVKKVMLQRSATTSRVIGGEKSERSSPTSGMPASTGNLQSERTYREMQKQRKVQEAVKNQLVQETSLLEEQLRGEAQERRRLMKDVKIARSVRTTKVKIASPAYFKPWSDPSPKRHMAELSAIQDDKV